MNDRWIRGVDHPGAEPVDLRAGSVRASLDGVDLRSVRLEGGPLVDRVYVAVRDRDWDTIPAVVSDLDVRQEGSAFAVSFDARHRARDIDFAWHGTITGDADGTIRSDMSGEARSTFEYCRIGFCVLHPDALAGSAYQAETPDGLVTGTLPMLIAPQTIVDGALQPLIPAFDALRLDAADGTRIRFMFAGDLFETEDQRNWTDASFKTYCTPIGLAHPFRAEPGQRFEQSVTIRPDEAGSAARASASSERATITLGPTTGRRLPRVGLGSASDGGPLSAREQDLLRPLRLDHLRVDVHPVRPGWEALLDEAVRQAGQVGCELEVALFLPSVAGTPDPSLATAVAERVGRAPVARWLVFDDPSAGAPRTPRGLAGAMRERIAGGGKAPVVAGGTDGDFAELNRSRPATDELDALTFAIDPRVHASDDRSIMENVTAQGTTVATARSFADGRAICVSPVTLAARFNPVAKGPAPPTPAGELPSAVDHRQMSLLGAAWTVGSISSLAAAGADSVTWYETVGWRGLMERESGSPVPDRFLSTPGMTFPMYHVFADLAEMRDGDAIAMSFSDPRSVTGHAVVSGRRINGHVANLRAVDVPISLGPVGPEVRYRVLDLSTVPVATSDPAAFRRMGGAVATIDGWLSMTLGPYAVLVFGADDVR